MHGPARYVNDGRISNLFLNSKFKKFKLYSTRRVPSNTEILTRYGKEYWE